MKKNKPVRKYPNSKVKPKSKYNPEELELRRKAPLLSEVYDQATFFPMPLDSLLKGIDRMNNGIKGVNRLIKDSIENHAETMLATYKGYWWLNYRGERGGTGGFISRKYALDWFEGAGR